MTSSNAIEVGAVLDNGDTVFHVTETDYWVVAPRALWKECKWHEGATYCQSIGYELPNKETVEILYDNRNEAHGLPTGYVWSSTEYNSDRAWNLYFSTGNWYYGIKSLSLWVVPFRRIAKTASDAVVDNTKAIDVGTILENGDTVFHVTDTEYWVVAPQSLWKVCAWEVGARYCQEIGYELPSRDVLQVLYDASEVLGHAFKKIHCNAMLTGTYVWSSTENASYYAWNLSFSSGNWYYNFKNFSYWVVPFRRMQKDIGAVDPIYTEVAPGIYSVADLKTAIGVLDRIHCDLDDHTVNTGHPVERTPVLVGGEAVTLDELPYPVLLMGVRDRAMKRLRLYAAPLPSNDSTVPTRMVVSAACKNGDYMLVGPRHFCPTMHVQADAYHKLGYVDDRKWEQGFIDQWETYMDRHEALMVALAAGQPVDFKRNGGSGKELYSEGVW